MGEEPLADDGAALLGRFVRLHGLSGTTVEAGPASDVEVGQLPGEQLDGKEGQCIGLDETATKFMVMTFDGLLASVPQSSMEPFDPSMPEDGGFDLVWPTGDFDTDAFAYEVCDTLAAKGYCVIQTFMSAEEREEAAKMAGRVVAPMPLMQETAPDYLGRNSTTRALQLEQDTPNKIPRDALAVCDRQLTNLGLMLCPLTESLLGFEASGRTQGVLRLPYKNKAHEAESKPPPVMDEDIEDGTIEKHITFVRTRQVCMLHTIENEGGEICLHPREAWKSRSSAVGREIELVFEGSAEMRSKMVLDSDDTVAVVRRSLGDATGVAESELTLHISVHGEAVLLEDHERPPPSVLVRGPRRLTVSAGVILGRKKMLELLRELRDRFLSASFQAALKSVLEATKERSPQRRKAVSDLTFTEQMAVIPLYGFAADSAGVDNLLRMMTTTFLQDPEMKAINDEIEAALSGDTGASRGKVLEAAGSIVTLPVGKNKLVLFNHSKMDYEYRPNGSSLALQSWMLSPTLAFKLALLEGSAKAKNEVYGYEGPPAPEKNQAQIMSLATRIPGNGVDRMAFWAECLAGTDGCILWPRTRMDLDMYYRDDPNETKYGFSYTCHGGVLQDEDVFGFDNDFFGMSDKETFHVSMNQRLWMEVGYSSLHLAGWRRDSLVNKNIGCWIGDVGSDWHGQDAYLSCFHYDPQYTAAGVTISVTACRLSHTFGMCGPNMTFDTACSASLYAVHHAHMAMLNHYESGYPVDGNMVGGVNTVGATGFVGNSMGNILTHVGRCFTFDQTADGYQRGEGAAAAFLVLSKDKKDLQSRLATIVGSCANHDGKSASLTAPSGPSQQACLRHCFRLGGYGVDEMTFTECHGTGTSLGDPIEMGAVLAVCEDREEPLPHATPKTNIGHLESGAGMTGLAKCCIGLLFHLVSPNIHLRVMNPHLEQEGFPRLFQNEAVDPCRTSGYAGVSSFGFGGSNGRVDLYSEATYGSFAPKDIKAEKLDVAVVRCPQCQGWMSWLDGVAMPKRAVHGQYKCSMVRASGDYSVCTNCYTGEYTYGEHLKVKDMDYGDGSERVYITGTWNAFSDMEEMEQTDDGLYVCDVVVGDARWEEFHLVVNRNPMDMMYPPVNRAGPVHRVMGPDDERKGKNWLINGGGEMAAGTTYRITFKWTEEHRSIKWEVVWQPSPAALGLDYTHQIFLVGSFNSWALKQMVFKEEDGTYEGTFKVGGSGKEDFRFVRDRDWTQVIHPQEANCEDERIAVCGPDASGGDRNWLIRTTRQEVVTVKLSLKDGRLKLLVETASQGTKTWESRGICSREPSVYSVTGSFNNWTLTPMEPDVNSQGVYTLQVAIRDTDLPEVFQIVVDKDFSKVVHPTKANSRTGDGGLQGPDEEGDGLNWMMAGDAGDLMEIKLDLNNFKVTWSLANRSKLQAVPIADEMQRPYE